MHQKRKLYHMARHRAVKLQKVNKDYRSHIKRTLRPRKSKPTINESTETNSHRWFKTRYFSTTRIRTDNSCFYNIFNMATDAKVYTDLTWRFPHQSSRVNNYILVVYNYDGNTILAEPMKKRETDTIIKAWNKLHSCLYNNGIVTTYYILDNECSTAFKNALQEKNVTFELVSPNQHRRNAAERAIRMFKNHLVSGLATCQPDFPLHEWNRILHQAELALR